MTSPITTHVLDTGRGRPAAGVPVAFQVREAGGWRVAARGVTDADGRVSDLLSRPLEAGRYRLRFEVGTYFSELGVRAFYPEVTVCFEIDSPGEHYHVPLLLSPFGYSTYRGS